MKPRPLARSFCCCLLLVACGGEPTRAQGPDGTRGADAGRADGRGDDPRPGAADAASARDAGLRDGARPRDGGAAPDGARPADGPRATDATADADARPRGRLIPVTEPRATVVDLGADERLRYPADEDGDVIPDFSSVGYRAGGVALPEVAVVETVTPASGDASARIQAAIDRVAARPLGADGFRGAVLLRAGRYEVGTTITVAASGVVLRGEGAGADGTVLVATGTTQRAAISLHGTGSLREVAGSRRAIADARVPVGATRLRLASVAGLAVGDAIVVFRPSTAAWIRSIGMDQIHDDGDTVQWAAGAYDLHYERVVTAIDGDAITIDAPVMNALDAAWGGGAVYASTFEGRITNVGVERLRLDSTYAAGQETSDEAHAWIGVQLEALEHAWVRDVTALHFGWAAVSVEGKARFVTVQDCEMLDPVSQITGGRRYSFNVDGQRTLVQRVRTRGGRHDFVNGAKVLGPNVFLDGVAEDTHADIGPHHRWTTGTLFDRIKGGEMAVQDRGDYGTGHGWSGAQIVFWNVEASSLACERPPGAENWCIGLVGRHVPGRLARTDGHFELEGRHASPSSLFLAQLEDRLGPAAVLAITTPAQRR